MTYIIARVLEFLASFSCWFSSMYCMFSTFLFTMPTIFDSRPDLGWTVSCLFSSRQLRLQLCYHRLLLHSCLATSFTPNPASNKLKAWACSLTVSTLVQDVCLFSELVILFDDIVNINIYILLWHHQRVHLGEDNCWYVRENPLV